MQVAATGICGGNNTDSSVSCVYFRGGGGGGPRVFHMCTGQTLVGFVRPLADLSMICHGVDSQVRVCRTQQRVDGQSIMERSSGRGFGTPVVRGVCRSPL